MVGRAVSPLSLDELFGRHALGSDRPHDYIAWAEQQLLAGEGSEALVTLAGLDLGASVDTGEVLQWFTRATAELGVTWPDDEQALRNYSGLLCRQILSGTLTPDEGLTRLSRIWQVTGYTQHLYSIWDELGDDIDLLADGYGPLYNSGLRTTNTDEYIRKVAGQFLQMLSCKLSNEFFNPVYCQDCRQIARPQTVRLALSWLPEKLYRLIFRRGPAYQLACAGCGSKELLTMRDYDGREKYLAEFCDTQGTGGRLDMHLHSYLS